MLTMRSLTLLLLLLLFTPILPAHAGAGRSLSLDQALELALKNNHDIGKAEAYGEYVEGRYREERAAALPQLSLSAAARYQRDGSQAPDTVGRRLSSGQVSLDLTQPLFTWGKIGAAIRAAEVGRQTAVERGRQARQTVVRDVTAAFYDVLLADQLLQLAQQNLAQKERHLDEAQKKFAAGVATDYDVLAAEVALENARPELIRGENQLRFAYDALGLLLPDAGPFTASGSLESERQPPQDQAAAIALALAERPDLAEQDQQVAIYRELVTIAAADDKPRLDLRGGAAWNSWEGPGDHGDGPGWNGGVYLSFPFFDGWRTAGRVAAAKSELRTRRLEEAQLRDFIVREVRDAIRAVRQSDQIVVALSGTVKQALRLLEMAEQGFGYGVKTRLDVEDAQLNLLQAESNLARARRDSLVARSQLVWATGGGGRSGSD